MSLKEDILKEMDDWKLYDEQYTRLLVPFGVNKGVFSETEAVELKEKLDDFYGNKEDPEYKKRRGKMLLEIFKEVGLSGSRILTTMIDLFPDRYIGNPEDCIMVSVDDYIQRKFSMEPVMYYQIMDDLVEQGFITKVMNKKLKKMTYKLEFDKINEVAMRESKD